MGAFESKFEFVLSVASIPFIVGLTEHCVIKKAAYFLCIHGLGQHSAVDVVVLAQQGGGVNNFTAYMAYYTTPLLLSIVFTFLNG